MESVVPAHEPDENEAPAVLENVINPAADVALEAQPPQENEELPFPAAEEDPNPPPPIQETHGEFLLPFRSPPFAPRFGKLDAVRPPPVEFLLPFASPPFAPRGIGKLNVARPPPQIPFNIGPPPAAGEFLLIPFESLPFAPRIGKLNVVRPPIHINIDPPVLDGSDVVEAAPPVLDAAANLEPGFSPTVFNVASSNDVVEPQVFPIVVEAGSSNAAASLHDVVEPPVADAGPSNAAASFNDVVAPLGLPVIPPGTPPFVRRLFEFLTRAMHDANLSSVMAWIDDFTFQVFNQEGLKTYFGQEMQFSLDCKQFGMVEVAEDVWRHRQGYLRRGRPELLQAVQTELQYIKE